MAEVGKEDRLVLRLNFLENTLVANWKVFKAQLKIYMIAVKIRYDLAVYANEMHTE